MAVPGRTSAAPGGPTEFLSEEFFPATTQPSYRGRLRYEKAHSAQKPISTRDSSGQKTGHGGSME